MPPYWHIIRPDLDNLVKAVLDALNEIVWVDDSQVCYQTISKTVCSGSEEPGVDILVFEV